MAMWYDTLVDAAIFREWIANIGRRTAHARIAHLLCELALRMQIAGLGSADVYTLPMSQEWIGDALSLTSVHVNRVLKSLENDGLLRRSKRRIEFLDWQRMREVGDFDPSYLHLDQVNLAAL